MARRIVYVREDIIKSLSTTVRSPNKTQPNPLLTAKLDRPPSEPAMICQTPDLVHASLLADNHVKI